MIHLVTFACQVQLLSAACALPFYLVHILFHEDNLLDEAIEVRGDRVQKFNQRDVNLLHFLLETLNALLKLLALSLVVLVLLRSFNQDLSGDV